MASFTLCTMHYALLNKYGIKYISFHFIPFFSYIKTHPYFFFRSFHRSFFFYYCASLCSNPLVYNAQFYSPPLYPTLLYSALLHSTLLYSTLLYFILFYSTILLYSPFSPFISIPPLHLILLCSKKIVCNVPVLEAPKESICHVTPCFLFAGVSQWRKISASDNYHTI